MTHDHHFYWTRYRAVRTYLGQHPKMLAKHGKVLDFINRYVDRETPGRFSFTALGKALSASRWTAKRLLVRLLTRLTEVSGVPRHEQEPEDFHPVVRALFDHATDQEPPTFTA